MEKIAPGEIVKTYKHLFEKIVAFDNLLLAAKKAQKGKRFKTATARFHINLEKELLCLQRQLKNQSYSPGPYTEFYIFEPKKRMISAAPYRDRVVHHALCNVIEPIFENTFIFDSYANRKRKGTHRAILRYQQFCRKNRYVLKCDVVKFFPSIDHMILKNEIRRKITDPDALWLIDNIIDHSNEQESVLHYFPGDDLFQPYERRRGLPIGNLTSQFFANVYMNRFDHFVKENLKCRYYVRYVDDWAVFHDDKSFLHDALFEFNKYLEILRLRMHATKSKVFPVDVGLTFLGHRIFTDHRLLKRDNVVRFKRRLKVYQKLYRQDDINWTEVKQRLQSWNAHAAFSDTYRLRMKLFSEFGFSKDAA